MISTFQCTNISCKNIFTVQRKINTAKCPTCSTIINLPLVDHVDKYYAPFELRKKTNIVKKCKDCETIYQTNIDDKKQLCQKCDKKEAPIANIFIAQKINKMQLKKHETRKKIKRQIRDLDDSFNNIISICKKLDISQEDLNEISSFLLKVLLKCNIKLDEKIKKFNKSVN